MKIYLTFGQIHAHTINGITYDKDCVAVMEEENEVIAREKIFNSQIGDKFMTTYTEESWDEDDLKYFSRGYIKLQL